MLRILGVRLRLSRLSIKSILKKMESPKMSTLDTVNMKNLSKPQRLSEDNLTSVFQSMLNGPLKMPKKLLLIFVIH